MNSFAWMDFYSELATALLEFANDRKPLIEKVKAIYANAGMKLPTLERDNNIVDIDPFTVFGLFNKGITNDNRIAILNQIKKLFNISASVPTDFDGIPVLNNMSATFYYFSDGRGEKDIDNLWTLFQYAISYADTQEDEAKFVAAFDTVVAQKGVSWNITMGLYWIRPMTFINLDARNRKLLENNQSRFKPDIDIIKIKIVGLIRSLFWTEEADLHDVTDNLFKGLSVLFVHSQKHKGQQDDYHNDCRHGCAHKCFTQKEQRYSYSRTAAKAYELAFREVEHYLRLNCV